MSDNCESEPWEKDGVFVRFQNNGRQTVSNVKDYKDGKAIDEDTDRAQASPFPFQYSSSNRRSCQYAGNTSNMTIPTKEEDDALGLIHQPESCERRFAGGRVSVKGRMYSAWLSNLILFDNEDINDPHSDSSDDDNENHCEIPHGAIGFSSRKSHDQNREKTWFVGGENISGNKMDEHNRQSGPWLDKLRVTRSSTVKLKTVLENTYRMDPIPDQMFVWHKVRNMINKMFERVMPQYTYNANTGPLLCQRLSHKIVSLVKKNYDWPRYRYVCLVTLVQLRNQGVIVADRALWDKNTDNVAVATHFDKDFACIVTLHAIFTE